MTPPFFIMKMVGICNFITVKKFQTKRDVNLEVRSVTFQGKTKKVEQFIVKSEQSIITVIISNPNHICFPLQKFHFSKKCLQ